MLVLAMQFSKSTGGC